MLCGSEEAANSLLILFPDLDCNTKYVVRIVGYTLMNPDTCARTHH